MNAIRTRGIKLISNALNFYRIIWARFVKADTGAALKVFSSKFRFVYK